MVKIPTKPQSAPQPSDVPLVIMCVERCGAAVELPWEFLNGPNTLMNALRAIGWFLSLGGARERGDTTTPNMVFAPLCDGCSRSPGRTST